MPTEEANAEAAETPEKEAIAEEAEAPKEEAKAEVEEGPPEEAKAEVAEAPKEAAKAEAATAPQEEAIAEAAVARKEEAKAEATVALTEEPEPFKEEIQKTQGSEGGVTDEFVVVTERYSPKSPPKHLASVAPVPASTTESSMIFKLDHDRWISARLPRPHDEYSLVEELEVPAFVVNSERYVPDATPKYQVLALPGIHLTGKVLTPPPELKVTIPEGFDGSSLVFELDNRRQISVPVPRGKCPGESFYVKPPALMVRAPEGVPTGELVSFAVRGGDGDNTKIEWFRARIPEKLQCGYFVARLPSPADEHSFLIYDKVKKGLSEFLVNAESYL